MLIYLFCAAVIIVLWMVFNTLLSIERSLRNLYELMINLDDRDAPRNIELNDNLDNISSRLERVTDILQDIQYVAGTYYKYNLPDENEQKERDDIV